MTSRWLFGWRGACLFFTVMLAGVANEDPAAAAGSSGDSSRGHVVLEVRTCDSVAEEAVRRVVAIELGDLLCGSGQVPPAGSDRLVLRCSGNLVFVEAASADRSTFVDRRLRLDDFPGDAAPRVLALAGIEVLAALSPAVRQRLADRQAGTTAPAPAKTILSSTTPAASPSSTTLLGAAAIFRTFLVPGGMSGWGGKVALESQIGRWFGLGFDVEAAGTRRRIDLGETSGWMFSAGVFAGMNLGSRLAGATLMAGARLGAVHLSGDAAGAANVAAERVTRPWGGPAVCAQVHGGLGPVDLRFAAEAGQSIVAAEGLADSSTVLAARGAWVALSLGAAYRIDHGQ